MKKYITAALLFCAALTAACSKETAGSADTGDTGALEMRVSATRAEADGEYDPLQRLAVRIYRASGELLRQYTAETLPSRLELLAGEYRVEVDAGEAVPASFTKRFYKGEKTFTVAAGQTTVAEVECKRQNVVAEVKFDATVSAAFGENFHAWVVAADAFDEGQVQQGGVPALNYTADGTGYFTMPEGATTLTTRFEGTHPDRGVIVREARFEGVQTGGKYSVSFRFSKDLPGFIECFVVKVDTSTDDYDDTFPFSPEPSIESDGFDMDQPQDFIPGTTAPKRYMITTMAAVKSVVIGIGDDSYEALNGTTEGVEVTRESDLSLTVTLSDAFFAGRPGGSHPVSIRVTDSAGAEATAISEYRLQGLLPIEKTDYDLWTNSLTLRALVLDPNVTTATFGLRVKDGEWSDAEGVNAGEGIYTATFTAQWKESVNAAGLTVHTPVAGTASSPATATRRGRRSMAKPSPRQSFRPQPGRSSPTGIWKADRSPVSAKARRNPRRSGAAAMPQLRDCVRSRPNPAWAAATAPSSNRSRRSACSPRAISSRQRSVLRVSRERPVSECPTSGQRVRRPCGSNTTPPWAPSIREPSPKSTNTSRTAKTVRASSPLSSIGTAVTRLSPAWGRQQACGTPPKPPKPPKAPSSPTDRC